MMDRTAEYIEDGFIVLRDVVAPAQIMALHQLVAPLELQKHKIPLLGEQTIVTAVDEIVRPIIARVAVKIHALVELYLLVAQRSHIVKLGWHRDAKVSDPVVGDGLHSFQLPLLPGDNLHQVVPGTHLREINEDEIAARNAGGNAMPNAIRVDLDVGDMLLRSPFLWHRGYGLQGVDRMTFVGTYSELSIEPSIVTIGSAV